jgi:hypothetical protein
MRRFLAQGLAVVGLTAPLAVAADPPALPDKPAEARSWATRLNPFGGDAPRDPGPRVRQPVGPLAAETMVVVLQAEKDAYTRRLDVCHRLREIALETNDEQLEARANELEKLAAATYRGRVTRLGVKSGGPLPALPAPSADVLDRSLGGGVAVTPLTSAGTKPAAAGKTSTAKATPFKEVAP